MNALESVESTLVKLGPGLWGFDYGMTWKLHGHQLAKGMRPEPGLSSFSVQAETGEVKSSAPSLRRINSNEAESNRIGGSLERVDIPYLRPVYSSAWAEVSRGNKIAIL